MVREASVPTASSASAIAFCESPLSFTFFFNDTATTEIYTLSLHDALPICGNALWLNWSDRHPSPWPLGFAFARSEEHTSELQSLRHLVCRLLLEKKKHTSNTSWTADTTCVCRRFRTTLDAPALRHSGSARS